MILSVCPNPSIDCYAWIEDLKPGEVNRIDKLQQYPGGKGVHVALAIKELGGQSEIFGNWAGKSGDWIQNAINQKGINVIGTTLKGNNRKCYTFRSSKNGFNNTEILEPGPQMEDKIWQEFKALFEKEISRANLICLSGSWPQKAPKDAYLQLIEIAKKQKKKVFLDSSEPYLSQALQSSFFALHLNEHEAFQLCGTKDFAILLEKLKNKVELIAMTKGKEGLQMWYRGKTIVANVEIEKVISTVGSGDCLTAGIAWAYEQGYALEEMAAYGVACGAANCLNPALGMLKHDDVQQLLPKVKLKYIKNE